MKIDKIKHVPKVWGEEIWMANTSAYCGKKLILKKGKRCSLHHHKNKNETFYLDSGEILFELDGEKKIIYPGQAVLVVPNAKHRFSGLKDSVIIEISTHHEDSDSYREEGELSGDVPKNILKELEENNNGQK